MAMVYLYIYTYIDININMSSLIVVIGWSCMILLLGGCSDNFIDDISIDFSEEHIYSFAIRIDS